MPRVTRFKPLALLVPVILTGCAAQPSTPPQGANQPAADAAPAEPQTVRDIAVAYVNGEAVTLGAMQQPMIELAGGQTLGEIVLDQMLTNRLAAQNLEITADLIEAERQVFEQTLQADNEDESTMLLREVRRRRGLGDARYVALLRRNAGLRLLVQKQVQVTPEALQRAYRLTYGEKYQARLITVPTFQDASRLRELLASGEAEFPDLAVKRSTDPSAIQGGLLPPISPDDANVPQVIRDALRRLDERGEKLSDAIALDSGYALLQLERKVVPEHVEFADVETQLAEQVRRGAERVLMQQLARELLAEANVVVLDPALGAGWDAQKKAMLGQ